MIYIPLTETNYEGSSFGGVYDSFDEAKIVLKEMDGDNFYINVYDKFGDEPIEIVHINFDGKIKKSLSLGAGIPGPVGPIGMTGLRGRDGMTKDEIKEFVLSVIK